MTVEELRAAMEAAFTGDPDDAAELFADDAVLVDIAGEPPVEGQDAILQHFLAYGGRREVAAVHDAWIAGDRGALSWTVWFRADAHAYGQHGRALLTFDAAAEDGGLISRWDGVWVERDADLTPWGGD
ncbi:nuclear transport factor 2 family protein [Euzebya rosea]|uniref:nuclear transport factor 2 family protein n=1 Tax=Euzebya rosea TaxID=2052804 RepID=UPI000D3E8181|nr:nuclear transport factor 2 family protein [Euzebya rosea]